MPGLSRFPCKTAPGRVLLIEWDHIYYVEASRDDTLIRRARRKALRHSEPLEEVESRLPWPPFFRIHRSYIVNLNRVYEIRAREPGEYEVRLDPPVNKVLPVSRHRYPHLKKMLGM